MSRKKTIHVYCIPINDIDDPQGVTLHRLEIEGSAKVRRKQFAKYVEQAYDIKDWRKLAREMGFRDLA